MEREEPERRESNKERPDARFPNFGNGKNFENTSSSNEEKERGSEPFRQWLCPPCSFPSYKS